MLEASDQIPSDRQDQEKRLDEMVDAIHRFDLASLAMHGWLHSPTHRENMLDPEWRVTGIGIAVSPNGEIYITEVFADN